MATPGLPAPDPAATCLVTGASSGIGAALARELAARGHGVTLVARRAERLRHLAAELAEAYGIRAEALPCDLANVDARAALAERVGKLGLRVDVLVNNAGVATHGRFVALRRERELEQLRVLGEAVLDLCLAFVPAMAARGAGAVLIVSSVAGMRPVPNTSTYGAVKAFSLSLGEALHTELRRDGVAVTTLCPGPVETEIFTEGTHPTQAVSPRPLWLPADDVARAAVDGLARGRRVVIPGLGNRLLAGGTRLLPRGIHLRLTERFYRGEPRASR